MEREDRRGESDVWREGGIERGGEKGKGTVQCMPLFV